MINDDAQSAHTLLSRGDESAPDSAVLSKLLARIERLALGDFHRVAFPLVVVRYDDHLAAYTAWEQSLSPANARALDRAFRVVSSAALARYTTLFGDEQGGFARAFHYARALAFGCALAFAAEQGFPAPTALDQHFRERVRAILVPPTPSVRL